MKIKILIIVDAELKTKAIELFNKWLKRMERGYIDNYDNILYIISFIEIHPEINNSEALFQFLINN